MGNSKLQQNRRRMVGGDGGQVFIFANEIKGTGKIIADDGDGSVGGNGGKAQLIANKNGFAREVSVKGEKSDDIRILPNKVNWGMWSVIVAIVIFVLGYFIQSSTTSYAPQTAETVSGDVIQVQGNGNTLVATPNRDPITQYNILSASEKSDDGLFHTKIEVLVSFDKEGGLKISPKIYCKEYKERERRPFHLEGEVYSGLVFNVDCKSSEPIQMGNNEYFEYINKNR